MADYKPYNGYNEYDMTPWIWVQPDAATQLRDERDRARRVAVELEQRNAEALRLLEAMHSFLFGTYESFAAVIHAERILRGDDAED